MQAASDDDGSDKLYYVSGARSAILVKAPDENAVHVFQQPGDGEVVKLKARVFALFQHFSRNLKLTDPKHMTKIATLIQTLHLLHA